MAITFDYNQTVQQARLLDELAADLGSQAVTKLSTIHENVSAAWTGDAAKVYLRHIKGVQDDLTAKAKYLRDTAEFLRDAAKRIRAADAAATQAAQKI